MIAHLCSYSPGKHSSRPAGSTNTPQNCCDTAVASYDGKDIARRLSDMVVYTEPVKFTGFKVQIYRMSALPDNTAILCRIRNVSCLKCTLSLRT